MTREDIVKLVNNAQKDDLHACMDRAFSQLPGSGIIEAIKGCEDIASIAKQCVGDELRKLDQNDIAAPKTAADITQRCGLDTPSL